MKIRFLLDENQSPRLKTALLRLGPMIDVLRIGDPEAPPLGTQDPDLLRYLEVTQRLLVTSNRTSLPAHIEAHWAASGHLWGILWAWPGALIGRLAAALYLIWEASEAEEWVGRLDWVPF